jgi:hypothetical protein
MTRTRFPICPVMSDMLPVLVNATNIPFWFKFELTHGNL